MGLIRALIVLAIGGIVFVQYYTYQKAVVYDTAFARMVPASPNSFVVVETFTSQNCVPCVLMDNFMNDVLKQVQERKIPVHVLNFHTNSVDTTRFKDAYGRQLYTDRHRAYAMGLDKAVAPLPETVLNGRLFYTEKNRMQILTGIENALKIVPDKRIDIWGEKSSRRFLNIFYDAEGFSPEFSYIVHIALVEKGLYKMLIAGANKGKTLFHDNVVRDFVSVPMSDKRTGSVEIFLEDNYIRDNLELIAYVQNELTHNVVAATSLPINAVAPLRENAVKKTQQKQKLPPLDTTPTALR